MERAHLGDHDTVIIPAMSFKNCIAAAAKYLGEQIPGKGKATYTKYFESGIIVPDDVDTGVKSAEIIKERRFVPADGKRGGAKRVWKNFPTILEWTADVVFIVLDDTITKDVFMRHLQQAGNFIGIGRFRPQNNGTYGRFSVESVKWE